MSWGSKAKHGNEGSSYTLHSEAPVLDGRCQNHPTVHHHSVSAV